MYLKLSLYRFYFIFSWSNFIKKELAQLTKKFEFAKKKKKTRVPKSSSENHHTKKQISPISCLGIGFKGLVNIFMFFLFAHLQVDGWSIFLFSFAECTAKTLSNKPKVMAHTLCSYKTFQKNFKSGKNFFLVWLMLKILSSYFEREIFRQT